MADNAISRHSDLQSLLDSALLDPRVDALVVAIGTVEFIWRSARRSSSAKALDTIPTRQDARRARRSRP
jgi:hypothetical protein